MTCSGWNEWNLRIIRNEKKNGAKTKILVYAKDPLIKADICIGSQKLDNVHKIVYLGSKITSDDKSTREINQSIELIKIGFSKIKINCLL